MHDVLSVARWPCTFLTNNYNNNILNGLSLHVVSVAVVVKSVSAMVTEVSGEGVVMMVSGGQVEPLP